MRTKKLQVQTTTGKEKRNFTATGRIKPTHEELCRDLENRAQRQLNNYIKTNKKTTRNESDEVSIEPKKIRKAERVWLGNG